MKRYLNIINPTAYLLKNAIQWEIKLSNVCRLPYFHVLQNLQITYISDVTNIARKTIVYNYAIGYSKHKETMFCLHV